MNVSSLCTQPLDALGTKDKIMKVRSRANFTLSVTARFEFMVLSKNLQARRSQKSMRPVMRFNTRRWPLWIFTYAGSYGENVSFEGDTADATPRVARGDFSHRLQFDISSQITGCPRVVHCRAWINERELVKIKLRMDFTCRVLESRRSVCALLPTAYLTIGFQHINVVQGFKSRLHPYIWHSSSVLKQTFSRVWGNLFDITLNEITMDSESKLSYAMHWKGSTYLLHSESVPTMNIAIKGDHHNLLKIKNVQTNPKKIPTWALWL